MFIKFTLEYSAGLIQTGQSLHAIKFLMSLDHDINNKNREKKQFEDISVKEQWLILIGKKKEKKKISIYVLLYIINDLFNLKLIYRSLIVPRGRLHRLWKLFRGEKILYRGCDIEDRDPAKY